MLILVGCNAEPLLIILVEIHASFSNMINSDLRETRKRMFDEMERKLKEEP